MKAEHEDGISDHIQHTAGNQADHGEDSLSLIAHDIVENTAAHKRRSGEKNIGGIIAGIGKNRVRTAHQPHQGMQKTEAEG